MTPIRLSEEKLNFYHDNGFVVVEDLLTNEEVAGLRERIREYTHGGRDTSRIEIQIEPRVQRNEMQVEHPGDAIRKIGKLVETDDRFRALGLNENIVGIIEQILGPDIKMYRNHLLLKPPEVGSAKGMHQDSPYWPIEPMELCSCWFAIDAANEENGCMEALAGGHKRGPLPHYRTQDDYVIEEAYYDTSLQVKFPMPEGAGLFFHSLLPHYTAPNRSDRWRRAIALSYMSAQSKYTGEGESPVYFPIKGKSYPGCVS